jgi:hypothetical protein
MFFIVAAILRAGGAAWNRIADFCPPRMEKCHATAHLEWADFSLAKQVLL